MASIEGGGEGGGGHKKGRGVKKAKKLSTRVDMTPLVDLAFLLITFFIFTTTMSTPAGMPLFMPKDTKEEDQNKAKESGSLTVLLGKGNQVYYYEGKLDESASNFKTSSFDPHNGIRQVLIDKKRRTPSEDLVVVIKPNEEATYRNTVDMLDEMTINDIKRFALVDITPQENQLIGATQTAGGMK